MVLCSCVKIPLSNTAKVTASVDDLQDVEKRNLKETASHQVRVKQQKLDLLKNILNNGDTTDIDSVTSTESSSTSTVPKSRWQQAQAARSLAKSTPDLSTTGHHATRSSTVSTPVITSRFTHQRAMTMASSRTGPPVKPVSSLLISERNSQQMVVGAINLLDPNRL